MKYNYAMKNIVNITKCDKGFIGGLSKFYRSLVGVLSGYKHFSVRRVVSLLALISILGIGNAWGDNLDFSGNSYIFIKNIKPDGWGWGSPFMQNVSGEKDYLYVWGNNSASGYSEAAVLVSGTAGSENAIYAVKIPNKNLYGLKLYRGTSFTTTDRQYWNCTGDMYFNTGKNYLTKYGNSYTWDNYVPTSTASLSASSTSITTIQTVTLTPSLSTNTAYNEIKSTSYSVTTNPGSAGSVTSAGVFSATVAGTYIVTATVTYNAKDFTGTTKTATATKTITVTAASEETHDVTVYYKYVYYKYVCQHRDKLNNCKAEELNKHITIANIHCSDVFYEEDETLKKKLYDKYGCMACEMESFALFHNAKKFGKKAAQILTVTDNLITGERASSENRQNDVMTMIEIAMESVIKL